MADQMAQNESRAFEREKWLAEERRRDAEFALRERELAFKEAEARRSRLWNPLAIAILGASIAAVGNAYVSWGNGKSSLEVETFKAESSRIFEMIKTGDPDKAAANLQFLIDTGLVPNKTTLLSISTYLKTRKHGQGISLPAEEFLKLKNEIQELTKEQVKISNELNSENEKAVNAINSLKQQSNTKNTPKP